MADENLLQSMDLARGYLRTIIHKLSDEQLVIVPEGASNNVLWNLGHLALSHAGLTYGPCGLAPPVPESYSDLFKGGTSPAAWDKAPSVSDVQEQFKGVHERIKEDYRNGVFEDFKPRELMAGITLSNIEQALGFNLIHEGVHIGALISIRNLMGAK